jgi:hypothetical protein
LRAVARPMPELAPVITITCWSRGLSLARMQMSLSARGVGASTSTVELVEAFPAPPRTAAA